MIKLLAEEFNEEKSRNAKVLKRWRFLQSLTSATLIKLNMIFCVQVKINRSLTGVTAADSCHDFELKMNFRTLLRARTRENLAFYYVLQNRKKRVFYPYEKGVVSRFQGRLKEKVIIAFTQILLILIYIR